VIFVERQPDRIYGIVQFFGVIQFICNLAKTPSAVAEPAAILGTLDPVAGLETFTDLGPLSLPEPPFWIALAELPDLLAGWMRKLRDQATQRGATHLPDLKIMSLEVSVNQGRLTRAEEGNDNRE
jgi:hypothetical protein